MTIAAMFTAGMAGLVVGASWLVRGASRLALRLGLSPLVVGLTVVAFGTSAPELAVSTRAVLSRQTGLAVGNVVGSNIFNVLFILGLSALITPLSVHRQVIRQEVPILIGAASLVIVLGLDGGLGARDGAILLGLLAAYTTFLVRQARAAPTASAAPKDELTRELRSPRAGAWDDRLPFQLALIGAGLGLLVAGSEALVSAAVTLVVVVLLRRQGHPA